MTRGIGLLWGIGGAAFAMSGCMGQSTDAGDLTGAEIQAITQNGVSVTLAAQSDWRTGYCSNVTLTNTSGVAVSTWQVVLNSNGSTISQVWNGTATQTTGLVGVTPAGWNAVISPNGGTASFGFCGTGSGRPIIASVAVSGGSTVSSSSSSSSSSGHSSSSSSSLSSGHSSSISSSSSGHSSSSSSSSSSGGSFPFSPPYIVGADISWTLEDEARGATYADASGMKPIEEIMVENGFNYVRLRTFVDPAAPGGYSSQGFCDTAHTIEMAKRVKRCGMGIFLDFHMSDTWASLGSQKMPSSWVGLSQVVPSTPVSASTHQNNIYQAAHDYVAGVLKAMVAAGVKPDMVQVGNETNGGMSAISMSNWAAFSALVNAGIKAVRETDPGIIVWAQNGRPRDANFGAWVDDYLSNKSPHVPSIDVDGICGSTYGTTTPSTPYADVQQWFGYVINTYKKPVMSCEYTVASPDKNAGGAINGIVHGFANHMGRGSFIWEPTRYPGVNSNTLFTQTQINGKDRYTTNAAMAAYPALAKSYGLPVPSGVCR